MLHGCKDRQIDTSAGQRKCARCGVVQPINEFRFNDKRKTLRRSYCRTCEKQQRADWYYRKGGASWFTKWRKKNPESLAKTRRKSSLKRHFGISDVDFEHILAAQSGRCALCQRLPTQFTRRFAVDHDHKTDAIRGLLCSPCNTALGLFQDSPNLLRAAAIYIETHGGSVE